MGITFFDLKPKRTKRAENAQQPKETLIELEKVTKDFIPSYMTYIDTDGIEKEVTGNFHKKSDGTYVMTRTNIEKCEIYEKTSYTYKDVNSHFTYIDNENKERVFNRLDTLRYDEETNSYTGEVGNIEYTETEVELIVKE